MERKIHYFIEYLLHGKKIHYFIEYLLHEEKIPYSIEYLLHGKKILKTSLSFPPLPVKRCRSKPKPFPIFFSIIPLSQNSLLQICTYSYTFTSIKKKNFCHFPAYNLVRKNAFLHMTDMMK